MDDAWLAAHLAPGERVLWSQPARKNAWSILGAVVGLGSALYFAGPWVLDPPGRWSWVATVAPGVAPALPGSIALALALGGAASTFVLPAAEREFTAWAITDARLLRVRAVGNGLVTAWPRARASIDERQRARKRGRRRVRVEVRRADGRREARFRIGFANAEEASAFAAALSAPAA